MTTVDEETVRAFAVSRRAQAMPASPIRKLAPLAELAKSRGTKVYHLNIGQPDIETPALHARSPQADRRQGPRILAVHRHARVPRIAAAVLLQRVGVPIDTRQILATTGGSEAILFVVHRLRERRRRRARPRAVLRELPRLRHDGRTEHRAGHEPRPRRIPSAAAACLREAR